VKINERGNWRSFRHRNYRILFAANAISNIGTWAQRIAQDWLVLELTNKGSYLGLVTALQFAPFIFFSLHGGALADRFNKRKVLIWTNIAGGLSAGILGLLVLADVVNIFHVCMLALMLGISSAIDGPVRQAFTSEVVGEEDVSNAVSLNSANFNAGRLIGPAVSGLLIAAFDTGPSFMLNAASYVFVILALIALKEESFFSRTTSHAITSVREGLRYAKARPDIYVVLLIVFFMSTFGLNFQIFNALMARQAFNRGPASYGLLGTFMAVGSLSGALLSTRLERFRSVRFIISASIVFSISVIVISFMPNYISYAIFLPMCGLSALTTLVNANSYVQVNSDPAIRGRVLGIYLLIFMGGAPFGSSLIGVFSDLFGIRETVAGCGVISLVSVLLIRLLFKEKVHTPIDITISGVLKSTKNNKS
jgi:MFS family permease